MASMLAAALDYGKRGIPIFPCGDDKRPLTAHGFLDASSNPAVIKRRWGRWPNAMIAMATGPLSGISVMDLDVKHGHNGFKAIPDWRKRSRVISRTQSKGAHLFYKDSGIPSTTSKIADGVDTRGKGGYVILPPSKGYKWLNGSNLSDLQDWPDDLRPPSKKGSRKGRIKTSQPVEKVELAKALEAVPSDDYQTWFEIGCALYRELGDDGFELFDDWSKKSDKYRSDRVEAKWGECEKVTGYTAGTVFHYADIADPKWRGDEIPETATIEDFVAHMAMHNYIYLPTNQSWPGASVNSRLPKQLLYGKQITASAWLDRKRGVQSITWSPGDPKLIMDKVVREEGGWIEKKGDITLNQYTPPVIRLGDPNKAKKWLDLIRRVFPGDAGHIINFLAQRVQQPGVKINHAMVFGGVPGIGKDTILEGVRHAVGHWNFVEASPKEIMARFNAHVKSVILRVNEARDMGEFNRFDFYESIKQLTASPPETIPCEEKYMKKYSVANVTGVIFTTNHKTGGIHIPEDDRRHFVAWSDIAKKDFPENFWNEMYAWYRGGGWDHVAAYLHTHDISGFDPKAPPPQTEAWHDIVEACKPVEDKEFAMAIDLLSDEDKDGALRRPQALSISMIKEAANASFRNWLSERKNWRLIPYRLEECGYVPVRHPTMGVNRWVYRDPSGSRKEELMYVPKALALPKRINAALGLLEDLAKNEPKWLKILRKNKK